MSARKKLRAATASQNHALYPNETAAPPLTVSSHLKRMRHRTPPDQQHGAFATMLLSFTSGQHVGEASADSDTEIVGEGAAQGRASTWTGHCTGLTG
jgi:hypothetical protein